MDLQLPVQSVPITTLYDKVCQWLATGRWFSSDTPVSSTNKTDCHDITEILLKVALNTIKQTSNNVFISCTYDMRNELYNLHDSLNDLTFGN